MGTGRGDGLSNDKVGYIAMKKVALRESRSILTPQKGGFLFSEPYPFTHTLSPYTGCGFGKTACGQFCYAQFMPNWTNLANAEHWGELVAVKSNAASILKHTLHGMKQSDRAKLRIFMASTTDPYQPLEAKYHITQQCLDVFAEYSDLDLLVIQTRSPLVMTDFERIKQLPYSWLSITIETNDTRFIHRLGGGPLPKKRFEIIQQARLAGIRTQIVVSPCLPYTPSFLRQLVDSGASRIVIDDFVSGDGTGGKRTSASRFVSLANYDWRDSSSARSLYFSLKALGIEVGWSAAGFCGIQPRNGIQQLTLL
ncbi:MAG: radical SAM protein [Anaerolineae bacterium]|nr:radical SAM protein [Anaerolineae bacterium]